MKLPLWRLIAAILVGGFNGLGIHSLLSIQALFPHHYENYLFLSVGVIDSAKFKGESEIEALKASTEESLHQYVTFARKLVANLGRVPPEDIAEAKAASLDEGEIVEIIAIVAVNLFTNYLNLANAYTNLNRLDEAEAVYKQAEERKLESEFLLSYRYQLAFLKGDRLQLAQ